MIITATVAAAIIIMVVRYTEYNGQGDDQRQCGHDIVDNSGNVAADGNSMEGPGSVPLFSRPRVTQSISLK